MNLNRQSGQSNYRIFSSESCDHYDLPLVCLCLFVADTDGGHQAVRLLMAARERTSSGSVLDAARAAKMVRRLQRGSKEAWDNFRSPSSKPANEELVALFDGMMLQPQEDRRMRSSPRGAPWRTQPHTPANYAARVDIREENVPAVTRPVRAREPLTVSSAQLHTSANSDERVDVRKKNVPAVTRPVRARDPCNTSTPCALPEPIRDDRIRKTSITCVIA